MKVYQKPGTKADREQEKKQLELNGIRLEKSKRSVKKKYRFYLYQLELIALFEMAGEESPAQPWLYSQPKTRVFWRKRSQRNMTKEMKKAKRLAMRTLYVLGYDVGFVEVCVYTAAPKYVVSRVFHDPNLNDHFRAALYRVREQVEQKELENREAESVLGTDIEFVLRHENGKYAIASDYFSKKGKVGYDAIWLKGNRNKHPLAELRPAPSKSPKVLFKHIYRCMQQAVKELKTLKLQWIAGGNPMKKYPIGGHIHFSEIQLTAPLLRALDNYLTLPLSVLESPESQTRRPKYGCLGDFREQFHGGFEYRTPPSWITHPTIAKGVLCLAKLLTLEYQQLVWFPLAEVETQQDFYAGRREALYPIVQTLWVHLKGLPTYATYQAELDAFYELIEQRYVWNEFDDIRRVWQLPPYHQAE